MPPLVQQIVLEPALLVVFCAMTAAGFEFEAVEAYSAAARPARAPNTSIRVSEFDPSRLAPLMLTQAASPAA